MKMSRLIIRHAKQVVTVCKNGERILKGEAMKNIAVFDSTDTQGVSVVAKEGKIECIDLDEKVEKKYEGCTFDTEIDASDMCVLPGELLITLWVICEICKYMQYNRGSTCTSQGG